MSQIRFGSQEFFDEYKKRLNDDREFRRLGEENKYSASELIVVSETNFAYFQSTKDGLVQELKVVEPSDIEKMESTADLVYEVPKYETIVKLCNGESTPFKLVLSGKMKIKGGAGKALKFYPAISRAMALLQELCSSSIVALPRTASEFQA